MLITPLRLARVKRGLRLADVAAGIGTTAAQISNVETAKHRPSAELAERISVYFKGEVSEIEILYPERFMSKERAA